MKTVNLILRVTVLAMLFSTAFVLARPVFAEEDPMGLAIEIRAEAELAAKQLQRKVKVDLKDTVEVPEIEVTSVTQTASIKANKSVQ